MMYMAHWKVQKGKKGEGAGEGDQECEGWG